MRSTGRGAYVGLFIYNDHTGGGLHAEASRGGMKARSKCGLELVTATSRHILVPSLPYKYMANTNIYRQSTAVAR